MDKNIYYSFDKIESENLSELDFTLYDEVLGDIDFDMVWPKAINKNNSYVDATPIKIDTLIELLQSFKDKGANYVAIESDVDHHGYEIIALDIHASSEEEIQTYLEKEKEKELKKKQKEIELLQNKLDSLKGSL